MRDEESAAEKQASCASGSLSRLQRNWETLAREDPLWAICSDPARRHGHWDENEFFASGRVEIDTVLGCVRGLGLAAAANLPALDFGCGVGRLTSALSAHFEECWGVDISPTMIERARQYHAQNAKCRFLVNATDRLAGLPSAYFGFLYSSITLQHIEPRHARRYLAEFLRVLRPGGILLFQIIDRHKAGWLARWRGRLALRSRLQAALGWKGMSIEKLVRMHCVPEKDVRRIMEEHGGRIADIRLTNSAEASFNGRLAYLETEPLEGYLSKQYCVVK